MQNHCKKYTGVIFFSILLLSINPLLLVAQNVTSPYSILGIGDLDTKDFGRYFVSGSASIARRDAEAYNFSNPASLSSLPYKTMHFDVAMRGRISTFSSPEVDTVTRPSQDFIIKRVTLAFKLNQKTGIAFGFRPYSSVNYQFQLEQPILDGNTFYTKFIDGSGGINQVYFSAGTSLNKRMSAGFTASWLFGSLQKVTEYSSTSIFLDITKQENDFYYAGLFQGGFQYYSLPGKKWRHQVGITGSVSTNLSGELITEYTGSGVSIQKDIESGRNFKLPVTVGLGYSAVKNDKLTLSVEGNYYHWPYQEVEFSNSYTYPAVRISAGMEYSFKNKQWNNAYEKGFIGWGINAENSYIRIENDYLWDYSLSLGGGLNLKNVSLYSGIEVGIKGNKGKAQIRESYTQYVLGITLKDIWIGPKISRKYD